MKTLKFNLEALQHSEGKSITWKSLKFQELAQIGDEKGSFEVLLGGTAHCGEPGLKSAPGDLFSVPIRLLVSSALQELACQTFWRFDPGSS